MAETTHICNKLDYENNEIQKKEKHSENCQSLNEISDKKRKLKKSTKFKKKDRFYSSNFSYQSKFRKFV